jgi:protein-S-isoprenylcysteine O-methyltransferase Ste14
VVVVVVGIFGGLLAGLKAAQARLAPAPAPQIWFVVGIVIVSAGILLRWWSVRTLGTYFSPVVTVADDQPLITAGPYRTLRHPAYTGLLLTFAGFGVALGDLAALSVMVGGLAAALTYRIRVEERALAAALGARWKTFAAGRARLIPGIW